MKYDVIVGSEAVASGAMTAYELRRGYRPIFRGVHLPTREPSPAGPDRGSVVVVETPGVIAGAAAAALHGASWVDPHTPIELIGGSTRRQAGLVVCNEALAADEVTKIAGIPVTTKVRTAFDLGRHRPRDDAVARLDALKRATAFKAEGVLLLADRYSGARGLTSLRIALPLVDGGAASPKETWLRRAAGDGSARSTWDGRNSWSARSTTVISTAPIDPSTPRTSGSSASLRNSTGR